MCRSGDLDRRSFASGDARYKGAIDHRAVSAASRRDGPSRPAPPGGAATRAGPTATTPRRCPLTTETSVLTGLEPRTFWHHFETLTTIARPSRHEEPVIEHVRAWAASHGLEVRSDAARNLVIPVPATPGREGAPKLTLQGHLDMVCERQPDSPN